MVVKSQQVRRKGEPRPQPITRIGEPFLDDLLAPHDPLTTRRTIHDLVRDQYREADRIQKLRGWGGAQPHGNDRYQYSLEQAAQLRARIPGSDVLRPRNSLFYLIGQAAIYPIRYGKHADDCPTKLSLSDSEIQVEVSEGIFNQQLNLYSASSGKATVVVLMFAGNHIEGGPLAMYVGIPDGMKRDGRVNWMGLEPLLHGGLGGGNGPVQPPSSPTDEYPTLHEYATRSGDAPEPPEPAVNLSLRRRS